MRIVVTGIGAVTACGWSAELLWESLMAGETSISTTRRFDTRGQRTHVAGEVPDPVPAIASEIRGWDHLSQADRFAVVAAIEAVGQADVGLDEPGLGVFFSSSTAGMLEGEEYFGRVIGAKEGRPKLRFLTSQQINGPGDAVARVLRATGPVFTVSSACSSGAMAVGEALRALRAGEVDVAVTGGADSLCRLTYSGFNSLRAVDERPCRPFRCDRAGLSIGEGAGVLVLESLEHALLRGARPLAELVGIGASCDSYHMTAPHPDGEGAARAIARALEDAGLGADDVTFVNAHGTGTPLNDASEWNALRSLFGDRASHLPTTSIKGTLGHLLGSAGAIEAVATVQSLESGLIPATPGNGEVENDLDLIRGEPRRFDGPAVAISTSFAFGGANAALVFARWLDESAADAR